MTPKIERHGRRGLGTSIVIGREADSRAPESRVAERPDLVLLHIHWLGLLCLAGAAFIVWIDSLGRRVDFPRTWIIVLVVAGLALLTPLALRTWIESRISSAASNVVGVPVEVECQGFGGAFVDAGAEFGYVAFGPDGVPERKTLIKREQCRDLSA